MHLGPRECIENPNQIKLYWVLFSLIQLVKAFCFFAIYDILKGFHILTYLLLFKGPCAILLFALQKPFHGQGPLTKYSWLRIVRHASVHTILEITWITGLVLCGPFRFILLCGHGDITMMAILSTLFIKSISSAKSRGTLFFILGVISIVFFDHDVKDQVSDHPEGVHKSLLIHRIFELFIHLGLSDHKTGAILLLISSFAEAGFNSMSRSLAASVGGAKRLHALSTIVSVGVILVVIALAAFLGTIFIHREPPQLQLGLAVSEFSYFYGLSATVFVSLVFVADFYLTEFIIKKTEPNSVQKVSFPCMALTAFLISAFLSGSINSGVVGHVANDMPMSPSARPAHYLSTGAIISLLAFLYASNLLNRFSTENGGGRFYNSRRFVGFSAAGLPLYAPHATPPIVGGGEELSFAYHAIATLKQVTADRASFRIFVFLCLNLTFTFIELLYGVWTNSLGLISDGFHMLFDCAALVMGLYASVVGRWKSTRLYSYGFHRAEILSGFINSLSLMVISASITLNAIKRIQQPPDINTDRLMAVSIGGLLVNLVGMFALGHAHSHGGGSHGHSHGGGGHGHSQGSHGHSHAPSDGKACSNGLSDVHACAGDHEDASGDSNLRGVYLHVLADTLGSVGVIISSYFVTNYGWNIADPICSLFISGAITYSALPLIKDTLLVLGLRAPSRHHPANPKRLIHKILQVDHVLEVVNPCIWQNTEDTICCSMRLHIASEAIEQVVLAQVKEALKKDQISHLTIQLEKDDFYQHMEALDLHPETISCHIRSNLAESPNGHNYHHSHGSATVVGPSGPSSGAGWTVIQF